MPEPTTPVAVVLDNEAIQALAEPTHPKHRAVLAHVDAVVTGRQRGAATRLLVPTAVRVEAGWDRTRAEAAIINRVRVGDHVLDPVLTNRAAAVRSRTQVSVADAHLGVAVQEAAAAGPVVVLTSDPADVAAASAPATPRIVLV